MSEQDNENVLKYLEGFIHRVRNGEIFIRDLYVSQEAERHDGASTTFHTLTGRANMLISYIEHDARSETALADALTHIYLRGCACSNDPHDELCESCIAGSTLNLRLPDTSKYTPAASEQAQPEDAPTDG